jgi:hypothetical protein
VIRAPAPKARDARTDQGLEEVAEACLAELDADSSGIAAPREAVEAPSSRHIVALLPVAAQLVVALALVGVAQHFVGLGDRLEALLGVLLVVEVG